MAYLIEDWLARMARLSKKDGVKKIGIQGQLAQQRLRRFQEAEFCGLRRQLIPKKVLISLRTQVLWLLHFLSRAYENQFISSYLCQNMKLKLVVDLGADRPNPHGFKTAESAEFSSQES